ncbi:hypothetical protein FTUN_2421 [Frigoriglobus tundricola]|uniref:Uncharacterized protein n=1 Tax=Frigoriglobus tundricola TaxID=2774151 RepID=A0A6M5YLU9_9BACT|nr:hypothetical protein FTUN_2421 [Frigoriglobus tundricola]
MEIGDAAEVALSEAAKKAGVEVWEKKATYSSFSDTHETSFSAARRGNRLRQTPQHRSNRPARS